MLDDLNAEAATRIALDGFQPALTVETSPGNFQIWIRLMAAGELPYLVVRYAVKHLSQLYGGDPRAVSPMQPGRLPGFTNRKPKHRQADGHFPFVRLVDASGCIASAGPNLVDEIKANLPAQRGRAQGAASETPPVAAVSSRPRAMEDFDALDRIRQAQEERIRAEAKRGSRPREAASESEIDFAAVVVALGEGVPRPMLEAWLRMRRPDMRPSLSRMPTNTWRIKPARRNRRAADEEIFDTAGGCGNLSDLGKLPCATRDEGRGATVFHASEPRPLPCRGRGGVDRGTSCHCAVAPDAEITQVHRGETCHAATSSRAKGGNHSTGAHPGRA
ncbi:DNA-primase RepB domain-containing protein [Stappia indica]|uniref:DNA-primase RepB domain-containing protein n=1 Tax=Stappia indica TaxID=538381 RepID=UPI00384C4EE7